MNETTKPTEASIAKTWHVRYMKPLWFVERHACTTEPHLHEDEAQAACDAMNASERVRDHAEELLEACMLLVADIDREPNSEFGFPSLGRALSAIAKAKGERRP